MLNVQDWVLDSECLTQEPDVTGIRLFLFRDQEGNR